MRCCASKYSFDAKERHKKKEPEQIKWLADKSKMTDINPTVTILTQNVNKLKIQSKDMY